MILSSAESLVIVSKKLKAVYKRIAEKKNCMFLAASDIANPSERDQEHLDARGHEELANKIYERIIYEIA